jgi:hypothetical protein
MPNRTKAICISKKNAKKREMNSYIQMHINESRKKREFLKKDFQLNVTKKTNKIL